MHPLAEIITALQQNEFDKAETCLQKALTDYPGDSALQECAIMLYMKTARMEKALEHTEVALQIEPQSSVFWTHKGNLLYRQMHTEAALAAYLSALECHAENHGALCNTAFCYARLNDHDKARDYFERALQLNPTHYLSLYNLGLLYRENKEHKKALFCFSKCTEVNPKAYESYYQLGIVNQEMLRHAEAEAYFSSAMTLAPDVAEVQYDYATLLHQLGKKDEALHHYQNVLNLKPQHEAALYMVGTLTQQKGITGAPRSYLEMLFNQYAPHYDHHLENILKYQAPKLIAEQLKPLLNEGEKKKILDLGCGTGLCGVYLKPYASELIGIDLAPKMVAASKAKNLYDKLIVGDALLELQAFKAYFDLIVAADVLIYFGDLSRFFAVARSSLKTGGCFIFTVECGKKSEYELCPTGRFQHSEGYLKALASQQGFDDILITKITTRQQDTEAVEAYLVQVF